MKTSLFTLFALMTSLWMPAPVLAADSKVYPGSACVPQFSSAYADGGIEIFLTGAIQNHTSDTIRVICTIVRDNTTNTNGLLNVTVRVFIPDSAADLIQEGMTGCTVLSLDGFTEVESEQNIVSLPYPRTGRLELEFSGKHRLTESIPLGQYVLRCGMPSDAVLFSYFVIEP
jgi:hypothetical protein